MADTKKQPNPTKFFSHFFYKALIVTVFLVVLPLFPSQPPDFINQTLNTRGWEILHLVFVGIAVSYGLFSKRNDEIPEKESNHHSKFDNAQNYVSRFLQVSSVFDDDQGDSPEPRPSDEGKVQTWSNQYFRNEPVVVVEEERSVIDEEKRGFSSLITEKPLLLPIRSLKSRVVDTDADVNGTGKESAAAFSSMKRVNLNPGSKRFSSNSGKGSDHQDLEEKLKDSVVFPSPIPWRSRSGRMEMKEEADSPPAYVLPPSAVESEHNKSFRGSQVSRSSRSNSATSSPKVLSPSPSMSSPNFNSSPSFPSEVQGKSAEDFARKKNFYRSPPPPPPPPPPPLYVIRKASSLKPRSNDIDDDDEDGGFAGKDFKRSFTTSEPISVRTIRSNHSWTEKGFDDGIKPNSEKRLKEIQANAMEKSGRKVVGFDQSAFKSENAKSGGVTTFATQPTFKEFRNEEQDEFVKKSVMELDEESEIDEDDDSFALSIAANSSNKEAAAAAVSGSGSDGGPDVDKKADEFIAKFREQIRLQRIKSIKKSSSQIRRNTAR